MGTGGEGNVSRVKSIKGISRCLFVFKYEYVMLEDVTVANHASR